MKYLGMLLSVSFISKNNCNMIYNQIVDKFDYLNVDILILDFKNIKKIDSFGIGLIIALKNKLTTLEKKLQLINIDENIVSLFKVIKLDKHFAM